jgi:hypothetical protein
VEHRVAAVAAFERLRGYLHARLGLRDGATPEIVSAWVMIGAAAEVLPRGYAASVAIAYAEHALAAAPASRR